MKVTIAHWLALAATMVTEESSNKETPKFKLTDNVVAKPLPKKFKRNKKRGY